MLAGFALLLCGVYAHSQVQGAGVSSSSGSGTVSLSVITSAPSLRGIKGAPFSADVTEESDQALVDGNHIHREMHGRIFRDSEGRTRQEHELLRVMGSEEKRVRVTIMDSVQQVLITLDQQNKVATIRHIGQPSTPATVPATRLTNRPAAASAPQPRVPSMQHEDLGTMEIEGFVVTGRRLTHTMEAGRIGNDKPLVSVSETWYSDELKETLLTKSESAQSGQHVRKLVNIHLGDPDPSLFQTPPDYTVKDTSQ